MKSKEDFKVVFIGGDIDPIYLRGLTINGIYYAKNKVINSSSGKEYYTIKNDHGVDRLYYQPLFKKLDEIREEKLNILLD